MTDPQITFGSLEMLSPVGRPLKFGEPTVRREIRLPESLNERLTEYARTRGEDVSDVVRSAVDDRISGKEAKQSLIDSDQIRSALVDAIREERQVGAFPVKLRESDRERLEQVAEIIGYTEPQHLIEDVMRNLLRRPEEITEMLLGSGVRALQQALENEGRGDLAAVGRAEKQRLDDKIAATKTPKVARRKAA